MFSDPLHKSCQTCPWGPNWPCPGGRLLPFTPGEIPQTTQVSCKTYYQNILHNTKLCNVLFLHACFLLFHFDLNTYF